MLRTFFFDWLTIATLASKWVLRLVDNASTEIVFPYRLPALHRLTAYIEQTQLIDFISGLQFRDSLSNLRVLRAFKMEPSYST